MLAAESMPTGAKMDRRHLVLASLAAALGTVPVAGDSPRTLQNTGRFDFNRPEDNLRAYVKLRGSLVAATVLKWSYGTLFGLLPGKTPEPLLAFETLVRAHWEPGGDAGFRYRYFNVGCFTDLETGRRVDRFTNPFTGVQVRPMVLKDGPAGAVYTPGGMLRPGEDADALVDRPPFRLPWVVSGNDISVTIGFGGERESPLQPDEWPLASAGERLHGYTQVTYQGRLSELQDATLSAVPYRFTTLGVTSWVPWLLMGQRPGFLLWHSQGRRIGSLDETSDTLRAFLSERFPEFLSSAAPWARNEDVWTRYLSGRD